MDRVDQLSDHQYLIVFLGSLENYNDHRFDNNIHNSSSIESKYNHLIVILKLTLALNIFESGSTANVPGSSRRSC
jgi:hypothetical protein